MEYKVERKLATIINYCSNDKNFIQECIENVYDISEQIIVPVCEQYFDDTDEDLNDIKELIFLYKNSKVNIILYPKQWKSNEHNANYGHNVSRWVGVLNLYNDITDVLFLDADEIVDKNNFKDFYLNGYPLMPNDAIKFSCYWFFRDKSNRANTLENCGLLCNNDNLITKKEIILNAPHERNSIYDSFYNKHSNFKWNGNIIINHYSWVRTKNEMLKKVKCWGHKNDKNWVELIEKEFEHDFNGTDFVHGYSYTII